MGDAPLRLLERSDAGIWDLTSDRYSLHIVHAGRPHHIDGLFDYWLISEIDPVCWQILGAGQRCYLFVAAGRVL